MSTYQQQCTLSANKLIKLLGSLPQSETMPLKIQNAFYQHLLLLCFTPTVKPLIKNYKAGDALNLVNIFVD